MYNLDDIELVRININIEKNVKEWYQYKAKSMGMSMSQLMSYILTNYYDGQKNAETLKDIKNMAYDEQLKADNKEMYALMVEFMKSVKDVQTGEKDE